VKRRRGNLKKNVVIGIIMVLAITVLVSCTNEETAFDYISYDELDISVCAPDAGPFTLDIDNEYFPLTVGKVLVLEGDDDGTTIRLEITVLDETEEVAGVTTRVMEEAEYENNVLVEISRNFFVQAPDGTVCYYGEDVDDYEGGVVVGHGGEWRAGEGGNLPGIFMPGEPREGVQFYQEFAPGIAEDRAAITKMGEEITVPAGTFNETLRAFDWNPLEGGAGDVKYYIKGIGLSIDEVAKLVSY
jgi:hypothetical protein